MKTAFLQLTPHSILLTFVRRAGRQNVFRAPAAFELPESLRGSGKAISQAHALAVFTANCMRGTVFAGCALILCLDAGVAVTKEYRHLPAKSADLRRFAALEAETVLKDSPENYYIVTREYGRAEPSAGRQKAVLFAAPKALVTSVAREFRQAGLRVLKICPMQSGLMSACRGMLGLTPKNQAWKGKTAAVVDAGYENLRVALFTDGGPVFQKEFDSVWPDILDTLQNSAGCSHEEALREMKRPGFLLSGGNASFGESVTSLVTTLLETAAAEVVRNIRVVLSAERLELRQVVFCGALASHPDFDRYVEGLSLEVPHENVGDAPGRYRSAVAVETQAGVQGSRPGDFFTLSGMLAPHGAVDFLELEKERRGSVRVSRTVVALLCVAAAGIMAVEPILYRQALARQKADQAALAASDIAEAKSLQTEKGRLEDRLKAMESDEKLLPYQKSKLEEAAAKLWEQFVPKVASLQSCQFSGSTGTVTVSFTAASLDQFNAAMKAVSDGGYFEVLTPFTVSKSGTGGAYQCSASFRIRNFQPAAASGGTSSASSGASSGGGQ